MRPISLKGLSAGVWVRALVVWAALAGGLPRASAQAPTPPSPNVPPTTVASRPAETGTTPEQLAARLRKMEEMNQRLLNQFESMARQNAALSKTVQELSKKLDDPARTDKLDTVVNFLGVDGSGGNQPVTPRANEAPPSSPPLSQPKQGPDRTPLKAFYDHRQRRRYGFVLQSQDDEFELRFNGLLQADSRTNGNQHMVPVVDDLDIPRMRMYLSGQMTKQFEYQLSIQRSTNSLDLLNAWVNFHFDDRFQLRVGRFKAPFTYEWYKESIWELLTPERSPFANNFGANRQVGVMGWGNLFQDRLEYAVGVFDGPRNSYQDFNYAKDVMALVDYRPFYPDAGSPLKNFSIGGSIDQGKENNPAAPNLLRSNITASGNTLNTLGGDALIAVPFLAFNNGVREKGDRTLWELHATYFYKGVSVLAAWDGGNNDYSRTTTHSNPVHLPVSGYYVQGGYILTGESLEKRALVEPIHPFDLRPGKFGLGALEVQARYSELAIGNQVFSAGLADPNLWTNRLGMTDLGLNWYLNKWTKIYFDWEHTIYGQPVYFKPGPGLMKTSDLYWVRMQLYF